jgi:3-oxoacyl-[acyl-carrier-protein] synthase-3
MTLVSPQSGAAAAAGVDEPASLPALATPGILSLGSYLPEAVLTNADLERMVQTSDTWIQERTGIRERRLHGSGETTSMMAANAARAALEAAGYPRIDGILVATASPDTLFPSTACLVQRRLGLAPIPAFDLGAGCSGFAYGMTVAEALITAGRAERMLVVGAESMTSLVDYSDRGTCVLFGDGAGAAVVGVGASGGVRASWWGADGGDADLIHYGPDPYHPDREKRTEPAVRMHGKGTFRLAVDRMVETARQLCAGAGWTIDDVDWVVPHQANTRIIEAVAKRLGVPAERVVVNADRYGNTSAASIPIALDEARRDGRLQPGHRVVCVAFGTGSTWGGVALEWSPQSGG